MRTELQEPTDTVVLHAPTREELEALITEQTAAIQKFVGRLVQWYERNGESSHRWHQGVGTAILWISVCMSPLSLVAKEFATAQPWLWYLVPGLSALLAGLAGSGHLYGWKQAARNFTNTETKLNHLLAEWEGEVALARHEGGRQGQKRLETAFHAIIDKAKAADIADTQGYYAAVKWPNESKHLE